MSETFIVLGDQLSLEVAPWPTLPRDTTILMIESERLISQPRHLTRVALYLAAMRHFAHEVEARGFTVDYRRAATFTAGVHEHLAAYSPSRLFMNAPRGRRAGNVFAPMGVEILPDPF